ncbi:MAG: LamG domain-containing protein, partial [Chloroflexota bacterium]
MLKSRGPEGRLPLASSNLFFLGLLFIVALVAAIYGASLRTTEAAAEAASGRGTDAVPASTSQSNFALQFDGVDDYARVLDSGNFDFDTTFTIEAWVKPDSVSGPIQFNGLVSGRVDDRPDSSGGWIMFQPKDDHSQWGMSVCTPNCGAATVQPGALVTGEWHHLAATYDGTNIQVYHNGVLSGTVAHTGSVSPVNYLFLGAWNGTFSGTMDEIRVWNITRTPEAIRSTMFAPLQGDETGLVAYWPLNDGAGQFATDGSGNGQIARLGSTDTPDGQDPAWVISDSPVLDPLFQLIPNYGGLGTDIGITSVVVPGFNCGWVAGETVEIWWDKPEAPLATFTVEANGCFEGLVNLDDGERIPGSEPGEHVIQARGSASGVVETPFLQTVSQLHLSPAYGPSERDVAVSGCGWDGAATVYIYWRDFSTELARLPVDGATGCINDTLTIPRSKDGLYALNALAVEGLVSAAAYRVQRPTILLTPDEGPPGARVPLAGCGWLPQEQIDFAFTSDGVIFDSWGTSVGGCITTNGPTEPTLAIPITATLGAKTIQATGLDSGQVVNAPFTVVTRTLAFDPNSGLPGDLIAASGCGWVGNDQVTVEWGYPDTNGQPIRWTADVTRESGCFGEIGDFIIQVPANTIGGPVVETATGDTMGTATAVFTVTHGGQIEISNANGYAGAPMTVDIFDAVIGETITFRWDVGYAFDGVGAATSDFSYDITLPKYASVGQHTVTADGTKGFNDQATVNVLDRAQIAVLTGGDIYPGSDIRVEGDEWAAGELVRFKLQKGSDTWPFADSVTVAADSMTFNELITLPSNVPPGVYTLLATGNKGRDATTGLTLIAAPAPAFSLDATYAGTPPDLDGQLRSGEWDYGKQANFNHGFLSARSDESRLYILLDVLDDTGQDSPGLDNFWLSFDVWKNGQIDAGFDLNFRLDGSGDMILEEYSGPNNFAPRNSTNLRSAYGAGFGCFLADGSLSFSLVSFVPKINCNPHRTWEIAVDLASIGAQPGDTVRLGVKAISQSPAFGDELPPGFPSDFSELGAISLAPSKLDPNPPAGRVLDVGAGGFEIEVTQAIQDATNGLPLVADKETVVRVYPAVEAEATVRTFLYGRRNGLDLPGSPLVTLATVPDTIDRKALSHTANFLLPPSWETEGLTQLTAVVENLDGQNTQAAAESVVFYERDVPVIWVFPFNEGTAAAPLLPTQADMVEQEQVLARLVPAPSVTFVHRPWTEIGTTNPISFTTMKQELSRYYSTMAAAAATSNNLSSLPDMLFGFKVGRDPKAVGTSDPIYSGGHGIVVVGQADGSDFNSTTMVHEVNHNLDRSA